MLIGTVSQENIAWWKSRYSFGFVDPNGPDFYGELEDCLRGVVGIFCTTPSTKLPCRVSTNGEGTPSVYLGHRLMAARYDRGGPSSVIFQHEYQQRIQSRNRE